MARLSPPAPAADANDSDDLRAARLGDHDAAVRLVSRHGGGMIRTARRVLGRYRDGEGDDVVQEAFIAALTTPALPSGDVGAWLRAIVARKALDALRGAARRPAVPLSDATVEVERRHAGDAPTSIDVLALRQALGRLSPTDRAVLTLVDLEGLSMAETAAALEVSNVAVRLRAVRARRKLARLLRDGGDAPAPRPPAADADGEPT